MLPLAGEVWGEDVPRRFHVLKCHEPIDVIVSTRSNLPITALIDDSADATNSSKPRSGKNIQSMKSVLWAIPFLAGCSSMTADYKPNN
ncbi:MAG: hypothetical protein M3Q16_00400, partial [Pseudomonadota bacterium]|nr:hypothetical protein [Pseudomonadota bacterium]